jgi:hypothetical protein
MKVTALIKQLTEFLVMNPQHNDDEVYSPNGSPIIGIGLGSTPGIKLGDNYHPTYAQKSSSEYFTSMFIIAGIPVLDKVALMNQYWPRAYVPTVMENPWWFIKTHVGWVKIGWRKRVIEIDWSDTFIRVEVTQDDVTKSSTMVHAWTEEKAIEYLKALTPFMQKS